MLNTGISLQRLATKAGVGFTPKKLFSNGEAGVWYDPSDVEASLTWRRNLLEYTESFDVSPWQKVNIGGTGISVIPSTHQAPDGSYNGVQILGLDTNQDRIDQPTGIPAVANKTYTYSVWLRGSGVIKINVGTSTGVGGSTEATVNLTSTWTRYSVTNTFNSAPTGNLRVHGVITRVTGTAPEVHAFGAQTEEGSTATEYQPIRSTFDNAFKQAFPKHTLYQDHNGGTPVTGLGQSVGIMLDKSEGVALTEKFVDTEFDVPSEWVLEPQLSITNGELDLASSATSGGAGAYTFAPTVVGKTYRIEFEVAELSGTSIHAALCNSASGNNQQAVTPSVITTGKHTFTITATGANTTGVRLRFARGSGLTAKVLNFSMKEVSGSHATQSDSTKRPVFARHPERGRVNLLKYTEEVDNGVWTLAGTTVTPNATIAPDGTTTADKVIADTGLSQHRVDQTSTSTSGVQTLSAYLKTAGYGYTWMRIGSVGAVVNIANGVTGFISSGVTVQSQDVGNGWRRVAITTSAGANEIARINMMPTSATADYSGDGTSGIYIWGAQLEEANEATGYQKVVDDYDITESGYKSVYYLQFDGINDTMEVQPVTSTDASISVFMGHDTEGNTGTTGYLFDIQDGRLIVSGAGYYHNSWVGASGVDPEAKGVTSIISDGTNADYRRDGLLETTGALPNISIQGAISIFSRMDYTTQFTNGNMYQLVVRGATSTDKEIDQAEEFVAIKTGLKSEVVGLATLDLNFGANTYTARNSNGSVL